MGFLGGLFGSKIPNSIKTEKGKELYYNINDLKLIPVVKSDISSTQITIIIDGSLSNDILLLSNNKELSHKDIIFIQIVIFIAMIGNQLIMMKFLKLKKYRNFMGNY